MLTELRTARRLSSAFTEISIVALPSLAVDLAAGLILSALGATTALRLVTRKSRSRYRDESMLDTVFRRYNPEGHTPWVPAKRPRN